MQDSRTIAQHSDGGDEGISETPQRVAGFPTYEEFNGGF